MLNRNVSCQKTHKLKHNIQLEEKKKTRKSLGFIKWNLTWILFKTNWLLPSLTWWAFPRDKSMHQSFGPFMKKGVFLSSGCKRTANLSFSIQNKAAEQATFSEAWGRDGRESHLLTLSIFQTFPSQEWKVQHQDARGRWRVQLAQVYLIQSYPPYVWQLTRKYARI